MCLKKYMSNSNLVIIKYSGKLLCFVHIMYIASVYIIFDFRVCGYVCVCVFAHLRSNLLCFVFFCSVLETVEAIENQGKIHIKSKYRKEITTD